MVYLFSLQMDCVTTEYRGLHDRSAHVTDERAEYFDQTCAYFGSEKISGI